jgi:aminopeptidase N
MLTPLVLLVIALAAPLSQSMVSNDSPIGPGIPRSLAEDRARRIADLRYQLLFVVPESQTERVRGTVWIRFQLSDASRPLTLDFAPADSVRHAAAGGTPVELEVTTDHLTIPADRLRKGENEITIDFMAGDASLNRNPEFLYTIFVPARAHLAFPCFDQPDLKARWALTLDVPAAWEAVANGAEVDRRTEQSRTSIRFADTEPLSTYLFAFGAGKFRVETAVRAGRTFRMLHRETDAEKVARNREAIFDLHASSLAWLEQYTGIPYPWGKFDFLLVPSFQFGRMEHAGSIFYNASSLLLDQSATQNQKLGRASLIAHETAHMWFGDLVTMRWFDDVWLKEVFANFMAAKIVNPAFPEINHDLRFLFAHYPAAYDIDRTPGTNAIRQRLDNLNEAGTLYGAIIYQKAPIVMRQLETILGADRFRDGLREYLKAYEFRNATWPDLIGILDRGTDEDLAAWSEAWVQEAGRPIVSTELKIENGRIARLAFAQRDPAAARGLIWNQRLDVAVGLPDGVRRFTARFTGSEVEIGEARGLPAPGYVLPNGGGIAYGGFVLDPATIKYLLRDVGTIGNPVDRGAAWVALWDQMLDRRARPDEFIEAAIRALPSEPDEQIVQRVLGYTQQTYWRFLKPTERDARSPALERVMRQGLETAKSQSLKSAWFSMLRDVARSEAVLRWLESVWRGDTKVPGLTLAEPDYILLALDLAVREVPRWKEILDEQQRRTENPDRKARFEFVRPALSPDQRTRDAFFESLRDVKNRRREPWVLEALDYLHHPLRASASEKYIPASLELLREIQRTGDLFFPKRWTDATLNGHGSASAASLVQRFLQTLPADYPDRLRRVVLSSSDELFRASGVPR